MKCKEMNTTSKWSNRRARRKQHAVASLLQPKVQEGVQQRVQKYLHKIVEAADKATSLAHSKVFWKKVHSYALKILEATRAPVCNSLLGVPITLVDAVREMVRLLCQQITACSRSSQTEYLGGDSCAVAVFSVKPALDAMASSLAETLSWLTHKDFRRDLREVMESGELPAESCKPLARMTYRERVENVAKTVMALPKKERQTYLGGLKGLGEGLLNYARGKTHETDVFEEICLKSTLDAIKVLTEISPNSWLSKDLIYVLTKTLSSLWERPIRFSVPRSGSGLQSSGT